VSLGVHNGETTLFGFTESEDRIRSLRLGLQWDAADSFAGLNLLDVEFSQGLAGLGASKNGDVLLSRANGRVDYRKLTLYAARVQSITPRWSVLGAVTVQRAMTDLLTSELFGFGGEQFGRGFDPSEMVGDHGVAGKLELRYGLRQPFAWVDAWSMYAFYDAGRVQQRTVAPGAEDSESARSTGFGSRFDLARQISLFVEVAKPLGRDVAAEGNRDARFFGGLSARF
jgi:hemolysin activation/secretion protein